MPHVKFVETSVFNGRTDNRKAFHKCAVIGCQKKRRLSCNEVDRGSKFALLRKQANVLCRCLNAKTADGTIKFRKAIEPAL